jgi:hypothetical protein
MELLRSGGVVLTRITLGHYVQVVTQGPVKVGERAAPVP